MYIRILLPILILGIGFSSFAYEKQHLENVAESAKWRSLLKYHRFILFTRSLNDNPRFFLSKKGKRNPLKELKANLEALTNDREYRCRFPARTRFLTKEFELSSHLRNTDHCTKLKTFRRNLKTKAASLVFSSFYIKRPASMFGHTLLRLSRSAHKDERSELTDYAVNYSADVDTGNSLLYAIKGLFGGFKGRFHTLPYFYKIREYNDAESRDLWVYNLNLSRKQVKFLIDHLWEMNQAYFDYFYLDENCSYHLLALLDAVNPEWGLLKRTDVFSTVPADTIKTVMETPGLVTDVEYRASASARFKARYQKLDKKQQSALADYVSSKHNIKHIEKFSDYHQAQILDTAIEYFDYKYSKEILKEDLKITSKKQKILAHRAGTPIISKEMEYPRPDSDAPDKTHSTTKISLGQFRQLKEDFYTLDFDSAYHDILDSSYGFPKTVSVYMPSVRLSYKDDTILVDRAQYLKIENYQPWQRLEQDLSYKIDFRSQRVYQYEDCGACTPTHLGGSFGLSLVGKSYFAYLGFHQEFQINDGLKEDLDFGLGPDITAGIIFNERYKLKLQYQHLRYVFNGFTLPTLKVEGQRNFLNKYALNVSFEDFGNSDRVTVKASFRF